MLRKADSAQPVGAAEADERPLFCGTRYFCGSRGIHAPGRWAFPYSARACF
jgi:hypothetical protein